MVKKNSTARKYSVCFPIVDRCPVSKKFRHSIRTGRMERRRFNLWSDRRLPEKFRTPCLKESCFGAEAAKGFQQIQDAHAVRLSRLHRCRKGRDRRALPCEVIDLRNGSRFDEITADRDIQCFERHDPQARMASDAQSIQSPEIALARQTV